MDIKKETTQLLEQLPQAVFLVKDHTVVFANCGARARGVQENISVGSLISIGMPEYELFHSGKLMLTTTVFGISYNTVVSTMGEYHLFCLESEYANPELRAFALAAQALREPLSNTMLTIENMIPEEAVQGSPALLAEIKALNRNIHQMYKAVRNMSDAASVSSGNGKELRDVVSLVSEWTKKANAHLEQTGCSIVLKVPNHPAYCQVNTEKLERAFLNLLSNAVKYASEPGTIDILLKMSGNKLYLSIESTCSDPQAVIGNNLFSRFNREPSVNDSTNGIGLGITIAHGIAAVHKGTLLVDQPKDNRIRFTLSISAQVAGVLTVNSPTMRIDETGGYDQFLIELSDILPPDLYE